MRIIPLAILCALVGLTYWVGATTFTSRIEQDITTRTNKAIASYKPAVDLIVDGRDVTVTGKVRDKNIRDAALNTVDSVHGVRATRDKLAVMEAYDLYGKFNRDGQMTVSGNIDSDSQSAIKTSFPGLKNRSKLVTDARSLPGSAAKIALAAAAIKKMDEAELWIDEDRLKITGIAPNEATRQEIEELLRNQRDNIAPLKLITDITLPALPAKCSGLSDPSKIHQTILFDVDSSVIKENYKGQLELLADLIEDCVDAEAGKLIVEAHADHDGSEAYNLSLSKNRADNVAELLHTSGLISIEVASFAFGETRPVASNENTSDKSYNRRVEVRFINAPEGQGIFNQTIISTQSAE